MRILITQNHLSNFAGSEIVTIELAEYFIGRGVEVILATNALSSPFKEEVMRVKGLKVFTLPDDKFDEEMERKLPDIAWIHHQLIPKALLQEERHKSIRFIFHHMSAWHALEFPIFADIEAKLASRILFNSEETKDNILETKVFTGVDEEIFGVFGNPAPTSFKVKRNHSSKPLSLLVVTNHLPQELKKAISLLEDSGISVSFLGIESGEASSYRRVRHADLNSVDVVVSIGKTVQYSILSSTPIYCYDKFGGPGYLSAENFDLARKYNFSGRGFQEKTPEVIASEIINGYQKAVLSIIELNKKFGDDFNLSAKLNFVDGLDMPKEYKQKISFESFLKYNDVVRDMYSNFELQKQTITDLIAMRAETTKEYTDKLLQQSQQLEKAQLELSEIKKSRVWRMRTKLRKYIN